MKLLDDLKRRNQIYQTGIGDMVTIEVDKPWIRAKVIHDESSIA